MDPHLFHCNQVCLLSYINDIQAMNLRSQSRAMFHQMFIIFIQIVNLRSQSGATFSREFTTRIGSPRRLLRQSFQILGKHPNLLIQQIVQRTISGSQKEVETKNDWTLFQSHIPSYFPNYQQSNLLHYHVCFHLSHHFSSHTS